MFEEKDIMWSSASSSWSDPEIIGLIVGAVIGGCSPLLFGLVLVILGFGCTGITLGSCAAATMSLIHPVGTGSIFAYFQSCGMTFPWGPLGYIFLGNIFIHFYTVNIYILKHEPTCTGHPFLIFLAC